MSIKLDIYNKKAEKTGSIDVSESIFNVEVNETLVHQAVVTQMANERQVLAHTKDRSEVRGGGRKPWRQKGTGRARAGSNRSPIWIGGGVTFGPRNERNFSKKINKKMKQKALFMVLSDRIGGKNLLVIDDLKLEEYKTKAVNEILKNIEKSVLNISEEKKTEKENKEIKTKKYKRSFLIIKNKEDDKTKYSARNLAGVKIINLDNINILDLVKCKYVILTQSAVKSLDERYNK